MRVEALPVSRGESRRRCLTLAPVGWSAVLGGSRFPCLAEDAESSLSVVEHVAVEVAEAAIAGKGSWTPVVHRKQKFDKELLDEFWADVGFPSPSSRFWERRTPSSASYVR